MSQPLRVLLLTHPLDLRSHLNGAILAALDLVQGLESTSTIETFMLARSSYSMKRKHIVVHSNGLKLAYEIIQAIQHIQPHIIHACFAPRPTTGIFLRILRRFVSTPIVQTVPSIPYSWTPSYIHASLAGDAIVATSYFTFNQFMKNEFLRDKLHYIPLPFNSKSIIESIDAEPIPKENSAKFFLFAGDYEFGNSLQCTVNAFEHYLSYNYANAHLWIASRTKTPQSIAIQAQLKQRIKQSNVLRNTITFLGEIPTLLPYIYSSYAIMLPANSTYAKLDHPRVLLEALALGRRIFVGPASSLVELITDPNIGCIVHNEYELCEAMQYNVAVPKFEVSNTNSLLQNRDPTIVAQRYCELYEALIASKCF